MSSSRLRLFLLFIALACATYTATAWGVDFLKPTMENVSYGPHEAQKLDFYQARSDKPTPLVFMIHGGGWVNGDKGSFNDAGKYTAAGISVVSINYRFIAQARADKLVPPVRGPLYDAARALQFVRFKSGEWNIDKARIGLTGSSAGACTSLWIAFHADLADPQNADPVLRESTRVWCAGVMRAQTSLDPEQMVKWIPNTTYGAHAFAGGESEANAKGFAAFLQRRAELLPMINEFSPYALAEAGAPPIFMSYETAPAMGEPQGNPTHSANFGVGLAEKLQALGVEHELHYPGSPPAKHQDVYDFLVDELTKRASK